MLEQVSNQLRELGLTGCEDYLPFSLERSVQAEQSNLEFLSGLLDHELSLRRQRSYETRLRFAGLPYRKSLTDFDFNFGSGVDKKTVTELASLAFLERYHNICVLGPPGVGKTHIAVALSMCALESRHSVYFTTMAKMAGELEQGPSRRILTRYLKPKLLVLDEIGYRNVDHRSASLFFDVISQRYERSSVIITSNKSFGEWGSLFGDPVLATAILDRLLHHATVINIKGNSYRLKDRARQGIWANPGVADQIHSGEVSNQGNSALS